MRKDSKIIVSRTTTHMDEFGRIMRAIEASRQKIESAASGSLEIDRLRDGWNRIAQLVEHWGLSDGECNDYMR